MEDFYLVKDEGQLAAYQGFVSQNAEKLQSYLDFLKDRFAVYDLPRAIMWSDFESATQIVRTIPVPAYTNDRRMVMTPELDVWKELYLHQLDTYESSELVESIKKHYQSLSDNFLMQIVGHELAHWSDCFLDDFDSYETYIWFEEGMAEYISRKYFLTDEEFQAEKVINQELVKLFQNKHGWHSLNDFGKSTYESDYASIFYEYWRSFLTINQLVENLGNVEAVFEAYHRWAETDRQVPLLDWFIQQRMIEKEI